MDNLFYIIVASYNNSDWVEVNIDSILNQTYQNYRVIYIDDASTDDTFKKVKELTAGNDKFDVIKNTKNINATNNHINSYNQITERDSIIVLLDGDDWFATNDVLQQLNDFYNSGEYWMTYGGMLVYNSDGNITIASPQNTEYPEIVKKYKLYRRDEWRASHLRTFKRFLWDNVDQNDLYSKYDNKVFWHAADLNEMFILMEMCPPEKIGVVDFYTYIWNNSKTNSERTNERETESNVKYEIEIRNKKTYDFYDQSNPNKKSKLPQINAFSDFRERNSIPTKYSIVYNQLYGEFDVTILQDSEILRYINNDILVPGKVVADIHEPIHLFEQSEVYKKVADNYELFDKILTFDENLLKLPNAKFRMGGPEIVLNKNVHKQEYPVLQDNSLIQLYDKTKLLSCISSNKTFSEGHRFRFDCVNEIIRQQLPIDVFGVGIREIKGKIEGLKDYMFSVTIENGKHKNYFTEKILDCFLTGTIPIYCGCTNISDYFDTNGFIIFETKEELIHIIKNLTEDDYQTRKSYLQKNFDLAMQYWYDNDIYFERYIKDLI